MRYIFIVMLGWLFLGCSSSYDALHVESEKVLDFGMANSKKLEMINSPTSKTYVTITYLNPIKHALVNNDSEKFIVGTYVATGENEVQKAILSNFAINGEKEEIKVSPLDKDAKILKLVSSSNPWSDYLLVEAPFTDKIDMNISFENDHSKRVSAKFRKDF